MSLLVSAALPGQSDGIPEDAIVPTSYRITRVRQALRHYEADILLLNTRVKDLSLERQRSAQQFAQAIISQTRAELDRLLEQQPVFSSDPAEPPCEPAD